MNKYGLSHGEKILSEYVRLTRRFPKRGGRFFLHHNLNLVRTAWAGSQRYGALVWSGDIASTFEVFRYQVVAGLNMAIAGIPWWTTDIGGFHGGDPESSSFRELIVRWFQYGVFCPVFRLHGDRMRRHAPAGASGGGLCGSGGPNEVWSYGDEAYAGACRCSGTLLRQEPSIKDLKGNKIRLRLQSRKRIFIISEHVFIKAI